MSDEKKTKKSKDTEEAKEIRVEITDAESEVASEADREGKKESSNVKAEADTETEDQAVTEAEKEEELSVEEKLEIQAAETADKVLRVMADFDNYKKRQARQYDELVRSTSGRLLGEILDVIDNFERAMEHANGKTDLDAFREGTQLIYNQMRDLLSRHQVEPIEALGKPFDPNLHEAMMQVESDKYDDGMVALEISRGYKHGDRVLRHSKVGVAGPRKVSDQPEKPDKAEAKSVEEEKEGAKKEEKEEEREEQEE